MAEATETEEAFRIENKEDEKRKFLEVQEYLLKEVYPAVSSKREKLVVCRRAKDYQIVDGQLHYVGHLKGSIQVGERPNKTGMYSSHKLYVPL